MSALVETKLSARDLASLWVLPVPATGRPQRGSKQSCMLLLPWACRQSDALIAALIMTRCMFLLCAAAPARAVAKPAARTGTLTRAAAKPAARAVAKPAARAVAKPAARAPIQRGGLRSMMKK